MKTAFCGTTDFAATLLTSLIGSDFEPWLVVTPAPSRSGRGRSLTPTPVAVLAADSGLDLIEVDSINDGSAASALAELAPDVVIVCAFGQLIGPDLVDAHRFLNVHPSLVPRWRGAAPIERALLSGDPETGVVVMDLTEGLDDGPVLVSERIEILPDDTYESLSARLADTACSVVAKALDLIDSGRVRAEPQDDSQATYAEKIEAAERRLVPDLSAEQLERRVRALGGRLGTYLALDPEAEARLGVVACTAYEEPPASVADAETGEIRQAGEELFMSCSKGALRLDEVKPAGGRSMAVADYLRGHDAPARAF